MTVRESTAVGAREKSTSRSVQPSSSFCRRRRRRFIAGVELDAGDAGRGVSYIFILLAGADDL